MAEDIKKVETGAEENKETDNNSETETKDTYTKDEVEKMLQAESDRRVTQALKKAKAEAKKDIEKAAKLGKMDEDERIAFELKSAQEELEQLRRDKAMSENTQTTLKVLANRNLPAGLLDYVLTEDEESTFEKIKDLEKMLKKWVDTEVSKRIPTQGTPKAGTTTSGKLTKEQFSKLTLTQMDELAQTNPELFNSLSKVKKK